MQVLNARKCLLLIERLTDTIESTRPELGFHGLAPDAEELADELDRGGCGRAPLKLTSKPHGNDIIYGFECHYPSGAFHTGVIEIYRLTGNPGDKVRRHTDRRSFAQDAKVEILRLLRAWKCEVEIRARPPERSHGETRLADLANYVQALAKKSDPADPDPALVAKAGRALQEAIELGAFRAACFIDLRTALSGCSHGRTVVEGRRVYFEVAIRWLADNPDALVRVPDFHDGPAHNVQGVGYSGEWIKESLTALAVILTDEAGRSAPSTSPAAPAVVPAVTKRQKRAKWLAEAMLLVSDHPDRSDRQIAKDVGKNPSTLSRSRVYQAAAALARGDTDKLKRGHITRDAETGLTDVEAYADDEGLEC